MMIHEKLISGQFLLDLKNDQSSLLNGHHLHSQDNQNELHPHHLQHSGLTVHHLSHHHNQRHQSLPLHHHQPPSPPISSVKMDIYAAYAYQQQQQQLLHRNNSNEQQFLHPIQNRNTVKSEVLDLSRRCDSVETPRKTPSPCQTNSSTGTGSPAESPSNLKSQPPLQRLPTHPIIPSNLLYSAQAQQQQQIPLPHAALPAGLATLYPALYYSNGIIKPEFLSRNSPNTTPPPPKVLTTPLPSSVTPTSTAIAATDLLQTFANAAAVATNSAISSDPAQTSSSKSPKINTTDCKSSTSAVITNTATSPHLNPLAALDVKNTRPFKAFPRDPLVIAANFCSTDVLLDNPRLGGYTEYRKRALEQIRSSNGGTRTVTNPKMRRTNSRSVDNDSSVYRSSSEERQEDISYVNSNTIDESSDCDSNAGNFTEKPLTTSTSSCLSSESQNSTATTTGHVVKDEAYYERRRKNNAAAKKSRDRRRIKEDEIAIRAAYLEHQNMKLLCQIEALEAQLAANASKVGA